MPQRPGGGGQDAHLVRAVLGSSGMWCGAYARFLSRHRTFGCVVSASGARRAMAASSPNRPWAARRNFSKTLFCYILILSSVLRDSRSKVHLVPNNSKRISSRSLSPWRRGASRRRLDPLGRVATCLRHVLRACVAPAQLHRRDQQPALLQEC